MSKKTLIILGGIFIALFFVVMVLVLFFDVAVIGPANTKVGLSHLNQQVIVLLGRNDLCYKVTQVLTVVSLATAIGFTIVGFIQMVKRRSMLKVNRDILAIGVVYVIIIIAYIVFGNVAISYRPILEAGQTFPEPSFPSSHTVMVMAVYGTAFAYAAHHMSEKGPRHIVEIVCVLIIVAMAGCRLLAGVHWFTDIIAGVLLGLGLNMFYAAYTKYTPAMKDAMGDIELYNRRARVREHGERAGRGQARGGEMQVPRGRMRPEGNGAYGQPAPRGQVAGMPAGAQRGLQMGRGQRQAQLPQGQPQAQGQRQRRGNAQGQPQLQQGQDVQRVGNAARQPRLQQGQAQQVQAQLQRSARPVQQQGQAQVQPQRGQRAQRPAQQGQVQQGQVQQPQGQRQVQQRPQRQQGQQALQQRGQQPQQRTQQQQQEQRSAQAQGQRPQQQQQQGQRPQRPAQQQAQQQAQRTQRPAQQQRRRNDAPNQ